MGFWPVTQTAENVLGWTASGYFLTRPEHISLALVRSQVEPIVSGAIFAFFGLVCCAIALMRKRGEVKALVWLGIWSAMYGAAELIQAFAGLRLSRGSFEMTASYAVTAITYLLEVAGFLAWSELSIGKMRQFLRVLIVPAAAIGLAGIAFFAATGSPDKLIPYNNFLAACALIVLAVVVLSPKLSSKYLALPSAALTIGALVFAAEALFSNVLGIFGAYLHPWRFVDDLGFGAFLFSLSYVAGKRMVANERRLLAIENELDTARQIQKSVLPPAVPEMQHLRTAVLYRPMSAVAGDFYHFITIDKHRMGVLIADVSGHGVPAALISMMIKVAMRSVVQLASDPAQVLENLNRILSGELHGQFASAAYLWIDTETNSAVYSAAGHPPVLSWCSANGMLRRIESNGLLLGIRAQAKYKACRLRLCSGHRFVLYTDGLIEPENARGESFGDRQLEQVIRNNASRSASALTEQLLSELSAWQPISTSQQDDITVIVVDVL